METRMTDLDELPLAILVHYATHLLFIVDAWCLNGGSTYRIRRSDGIYDAWEYSDSEGWASRIDPFPTLGGRSR